jgi:SAM-dependent methyltransferase
MDASPDDLTARRASLEGWVAEQERTPPRRLAKARHLVGFTLHRLVYRSKRFVSDVLDRGLDTSGSAHEPEHDHPDRLGYAPSEWHVLPRALRYVGVSDRDTFVDFGCGRGRVVHQAAKRPFGRVIGVEISPVLAEAARTALAARKHQHRCRNVEIVVSDVTEFRVPDDLTVGYFYKPFGQETLEVVLRGIVDSIDRNPRRVRLIYAFPQEWVPGVLASMGFRLSKEQRAFGWHEVAIFESR